MRSLVELLQRPDLGGLDLGFDENLLRGGAPVLDSLARGIQSSRVLLSFLSKSSLESGWVRHEMRMADIVAKDDTEA